MERGSEREEDGSGRRKGKELEWEERGECSGFLLKRVC